MTTEWGYYWVERFENDKPSIAYKPKNSNCWEFMGQAPWTKMVKAVGRSYPAKILKKVESYDERNKNSSEV